MNEHPYDRLGPDMVIDAVESAGYLSDARLLALNSFENRVYQIGIEDGAPIVAKFYRPGRWSDEAILEEHGFSEELVADEIPVVAPLKDAAGCSLVHWREFRFAVFPKRPGRAPELDRPAVLERLGRFLARIHAVGALERYAQRPAFDVAGFGDAPRAYLIEHAWLPADLREVYAGVSAQALDGVRRAFDRAGDVASMRLHGDCHAGNVLWTDDGPHFVDFDDTRNGPAVQDLWMLLSGDRTSMERQLRDVLRGYEQFHDFDRRALHLVEALRTLRLLHYAGWIAQRWSDPAFPAAFPWFGTQRYWQDRILELREQIALMDEPPLAT